MPITNYQNLINQLSTCDKVTFAKGIPEEGRGDGKLTLNISEKTSLKKIYEPEKTCSIELIKNIFKVREEAAELVLNALDLSDNRNGRANHEINLTQLKANKDSQKLLVEELEIIKKQKSQLGLEDTEDTSAIRLQEELKKITLLLQIDKPVDAAKFDFRFGPEFSIFNQVIDKNKLPDHFEKTATGKLPTMTGAFFVGLGYNFSPLLVGLDLGFGASHSAVYERSGNFGYSAGVNDWRTFSHVELYSKGGFFAPRLDLGVSIFNGLSLHALGSYSNYRQTVYYTNTVGKTISKSFNTWTPELECRFQFNSPDTPKKYELSPFIGFRYQFTNPVRTKVLSFGLNWTLY